MSRRSGEEERGDGSTKSDFKAMVRRRNIGGSIQATKSKK